jgi:hypothetical protein
VTTQRDEIDVIRTNHVATIGKMTRLIRVTCPKRRAKAKSIESTVFIASSEEGSSEKVTRAVLLPETTNNPGGYDRVKQSTVEGVQLNNKSLNPIERCEPQPDVKSPLSRLRVHWGSDNGHAFFYCLSNI